MGFPTIWCIEHENRTQNGCHRAENLIHHYKVLLITWQVLCLYKLILCLLTPFDISLPTGDDLLTLTCLFHFKMCWWGTKFSITLNTACIHWRLYTRQVCCDFGKLLIWEGYHPIKLVGRKKLCFQKGVVYLKRVWYYWTSTWRKVVVILESCWFEKGMILLY